MTSRLLPALLLGCGVGISASALAQPVQTTKYTYYAVSGTTVAEIYAGMLRRGPHVNGAKAYASTSAVSSQDGRLVQEKNCQIEDYRVKIDFVIRLPRIKNEAVLPATDKTRWRQFSQFLKKHEETHRSIWMTCAVELERQVRAIKASSCADADAKSAKLWDQMRRSCARKHDAFDAAEQKRLVQHPFVKQVLRGRAVASRAAATN